MKKILLALLAICLISMVLLTSCSKNGNTDDITTVSGDNTYVTTDETSVITDEKTDESSEETTETILDNNEKLQQYIIEMNDYSYEIFESLKDTFADITITNEESTLVYTFKNLNDVGDIAAAAAGIKEQEDTLKIIANLIILDISEYGVKDPQVKFVYLNNNGTEIYSLLVDGEQ